MDGREMVVERKKDDGPLLSPQPRPHPFLAHHRGEEARVSGFARPAEALSSVCALARDSESPTKTMQPD
jgi:hypothetical protein